VCDLVPLEKLIYSLDINIARIITGILLRSKSSIDHRDHRDKNQILNMRQLVLMKYH